MLITYHGHSEFCLKRGDGYRLLTDPYDGHVGYPLRETACDAVTVSHGHGDHNYTKKITGAPAIIDSEGIWCPAPDMKITAIPSVHDDAGGAKRGKNLIMKIETEGLTLAHLGDQGASLTNEQIAALGQTDILFIPIGGYYTIDAKTACAIVQALSPRVVIPMHYKTSVNPDWPIADEKEFLALMHEPQAEKMPLLRITKEDLSEQPRLAVLSWE